VMTALVGHLAYRFADQRGIGACVDERLMKVALPYARREAGLVVFAELPPIRRVAHERISRHLVGKMERGLARFELFEHDELDAVRIDLERYRESLPAEVGAEKAVDEASGGADRTMNAGSRDRVGHGDERGAQRFAPGKRGALEHEQERIDLVHEVRSRLKDS